MSDSVDTAPGKTPEKVMVRFTQIASGLGRKKDQIQTLAGLGLGKLAQPVRVAVTGTAVSPPLFEIMVLLGRDETLARIDAAVARAGAAA